MTANIILRNENNFIVENIVKVLSSGDPNKVIENFDEFLFYNDGLYTFVGDSTFVVYGKDILCVQFNK